MYDAFVLVLFWWVMYSPLLEVGLKLTHNAIFLYNEFMKQMKKSLGT